MRILILTFYYKPDLSAGSFRTTALVKELQEKSAKDDVIEVITTMPNRYNSYLNKAVKYEKKDNVIFGSTVYLMNLENNEKKTYKIVGKDEADMTKNYIYFRSPIGKALIGQKKKKLVTVTTPSGEKNFEITEIKYI